MSLTVQAKPMRRQTTDEKQGDAICIRDAAIAIVKQKGEWTSLEATRRDIPIMSAEFGVLSIVYITPFAKLWKQPTIPDHFREPDKHVAAVMIQKKFVQMGSIFGPAKRRCSTLNGTTTGRS